MTGAGGLLVEKPPLPGRASNAKAPAVGRVPLERERPDGVEDPVTGRLPNDPKLRHGVICSPSAANCSSLSFFSASHFWLCHLIIHLRSWLMASFKGPMVETRLNHARAQGRGWRLRT
eukprot:CAMPEP_0179094958 /NCGR_PEP_ID=MMETSP0796-20121207/43576_1 /TAXON_ID=73915 /ORGANISM="Pyrodinium bahamense, Strain pbaha01" /LENGTH=117 /DNA_ID=CAMNT_0020792641 /DNA_START=121 /DNA_END=474 /DNA_ORIENTATION=+